MFICLQQAATPGWDGYELRVTNVNGGADLWQVWRIDNGTKTLLAGTNLELAVGGTMLLGRKPGGLEVWWQAPTGSWQRLLSDELALVDLTYQYGAIGAGGVKTGALDDFGGGSSLSLLEQYAPQLRPSVLDTYRSGSAAMMTDNYQPTYSNVLVAGPGG